VDVTVLTCEILDFHISDYLACYLLGYDAVLFGKIHCVNFWFVWMRTRLYDATVQKVVIANLQYSVFKQ
jgi:hypothetical protein